MKSLVPFTTAILAWVFYEASATETSCTIGSHGSIFLPHEHHTLIGHSFLNQPGTVRIQCMMLCWRHSCCLSFNHNKISGICQLNNASKEDFPDSYKQDDGFSYFGGSSNKPKPLPDEEAMMTTKTEQDKSQAQTTTTKRVSTVPTELSIETLETTSPNSVDTEGPEVLCPQGVFGLTEDSNARTSVKWKALSASDDVDEVTSSYEIICRDDDEGRTVVSGDSFKAGTTEVTCTTSDEAGNPGQCTFVVNITVCNVTRLGMESGAIADHQITAKNVIDADYENYGPILARLNSNGSWCGSGYTHIQVDFNHTVDIYGLIIQGRSGSNNRVASFHLSYTNEERSDVYNFMRDAHGSIKSYKAERMPGSQYKIVSVQTTPQKMIRSRSIRIRPWGFWGEYPCMRFELISCN